MEDVANIKFKILIVKLLITFFICFLNRVVSDGQFSFTSSLMSSLEGDDSENEKASHSPVKHTEL